MELFGLEDKDIKKLQTASRRHRKVFVSFGFWDGGRFTLSFSGRDFDLNSVTQLTLHKTGPHYFGFFRRKLLVDFLYKFGSRLDPYSEEYLGLSHDLCWRIDAGCFLTALRLLETDLRGFETLRTLIHEAKTPEDFLALAALR